MSQKNRFHFIYFLEIPVWILYFANMAFVSGGTGLVGARLIYDLVKAGEDVVALKRSGSDLAIVEGIFTYYGKDQGAA